MWSMYNPHTSTLRKSQRYFNINECAVILSYYRYTVHSARPPKWSNLPCFRTTRPSRITAVCSARSAESRVVHAF